MKCMSLFIQGNAAFQRARERKRIIWGFRSGVWYSENVRTRDPEENFSTFRLCNLQTAYFVLFSSCLFMRFFLKEMAKNGQSIVLLHWLSRSVVSFVATVSNMYIYQ